jgi:hypothetical protein
MYVIYIQIFLLINLYGLKTKSKCTYIHTSEQLCTQLDITTYYPIRKQVFGC